MGSLSVSWGWLDITERKQAMQQIVEMATHDELTGLPNRHLLQDRIKQALASVQRSHQWGAVLFIDLDHFKIINDSLGHDIGDLLLKEVAIRLTAAVRAEDTVAHLGGDEFIMLLPILLPGTSAEVVAQKIIDALIRSFNINGKELKIGASIGIALFPDDGKDVNTLLKNSDTAMYDAKKAGRNTYRVYTSEMNK